MPAAASLQETMDRLLLLICAGCPVIYIVSHEESRVLDNLAKIYRVILAEQPQKHFLRWDANAGLQEILDLSDHRKAESRRNWLDIEGLSQCVRIHTHGSDKPDQALHAIGAAQPGNFPALADSLTVFFDIHHQLRNDQIPGISDTLVRPLRDAANEIRRYYDANRCSPGRPFKTIVIIAPSSAGLSIELERDLHVVDFPLPGTDELMLTARRMIMRGILTLPELVPPEETNALCGGSASRDDYLGRLCELIAGAGRGLTLEDYKQGLNMFAARHEPLCARHVEDMHHLKAKTINNPALEYTPHVNVELGGLGTVRAWVRARREPVLSQAVREKYHLPQPKGVMLCGASGGGKSQLAKLIAKEFNIALLRLDVGALFGMFVGESEERTRNALKLAEVLSPIVLWIDEIDKAFNGIGGNGDNGVSDRVFGHFLTWLAEKQDGVFVVATANDFRGMLSRFPEFGRKGRFDEIFWIDLPGQQARHAIFRIYLKPLIATGYLQITGEHIRRLIAQHSIPTQPGGPDDFGRFCWILSQPQISGNMTGAEIEYAVSESLFRAYELANHSGETARFTPDLIVGVVKAAMGRALYKPGSPDESTFSGAGGLREQALAKNWIPSE